MSVARKVEFFKLSRPIQDRFVGSAGNVFAPLPLLFQHVTPKTPIYWAASSVASLVALIIVARVGYGDLDSGLSRHGFVGLVVYVLLIASIVGCAVRAVHLRKRISALPFRPGIYTFPMCTVDARGETFDVHDMSTLVAVTAQPGAQARVLLQFQDGGKFEIPVNDAQAAAGAVAAINGTREEVREAIERGDPGELVGLDPLHQPRFSSPVAPREAYPAYAPPWAKLFFAIGLGVGVVTGPVVWLARNSGSDTRMYAIAEKANDVDSYRAYLAHGRAHVDDVSDTLLPRAELRIAEAPGTVDALLAYITVHPDSKIKPEVDVSLRKALLAALEDAKKPGTLAALNAYSTKYASQKALVQKELAKAMHDVYARELASYDATAPTKDKTAVPFMDRLFAYVEAHGPTVEIKARRRATSNLDKADKFLEKVPTFMGQVSYPTRYYDTAHSQKHEADAMNLFADRLSNTFSKEIFTFKVAGDGPDPAQPLPPFTVPTLLITHVEDWSTHTYETKVPRGCFVGVIYKFEVEFYIPNDPKPFKWKQEMFRGAALGVLDKEGEGTNEERLYNTMSVDAFGAMVDRFLALLIPPSPAK